MRRENDYDHIPPVLWLSPDEPAARPRRNLWPVMVALLVISAGCLGFGTGWLVFDRVAAPEQVEIVDQATEPEAFGGYAVPVGPGTVWVNTANGTYYRPGHPRFGQAYPGVFMQEHQAVGRGYWPALTGH